LREGRPSEQIDDDEDPALKWVPEAKYKKMSRAETTQLALDRYWKKRKHHGNWAETMNVTSDTGTKLTAGRSTTRESSKDLTI
jgi:hypothetical protein